MFKNLKQFRNFFTIVLKHHRVKYEVVRETEMCLASTGRKERRTKKFANLLHLAYYRTSTTMNLLSPRLLSEVSHKIYQLSEDNCFNRYS